ncbi:5-methylcytosine-specific restriction endonuclease McrA [Sagittula marina]|uniref:Putative HNH nuclease YajD n=1 Tax=Sagittula marina TaxID=943940 RepID=A0A7W6GT26_9RHOB|nr:HNH endonuclease signature motif containing protein [Sagittula marina]MBB3986163.1 5-methylcytosine-specific restriction endonuclease McrA [Sagittula marina]
MGKLAGRGMPSRLGRPVSRLVSKRPEAAKPEGQRNAWHKWYNTTRWRKLRWSVIEAANFTCQRLGCGRIEADTSKLVADHVKPHRGDAALFWDRKNLKCLCQSCHSGAKQREEAAARWL